MPVKAKICGINTAAAMRAAATGGAAYVGLVFYPPSPRAVTVEEAAQLAAYAPPPVVRVGLFVDPTDAALDEVLCAVSLDLLQLHGAETPERVRIIRERTGIPVMKAIKVASAADVDGATSYVGVADRLLFDAKAPPDMEGALPGGNALAFDWELLGERSWPCPWMLSGGLGTENLAEAVRISGARAVDVSSGVESAPGRKDPAKIAAFLRAARSL